MTSDAKGSAWEEAPRNEIIADVASFLDAKLKLYFGSKSWCTADASTDPNKVEPERCPVVVLWEGSEKGPDQEPPFPLDRCYLQVRALAWVKDKKSALEVQRELNRVVWCLKKGVHSLVEAGGRQVTGLNMGAAVETNAGDSDGDVMYLFTLQYDAALE